MGLGMGLGMGMGLDMGKPSMFTKSLGPTQVDFKYGFERAHEIFKYYFEQIKYGFERAAKTILKNAPGKS